MLLQLPFFPPHVKLINETLGFREQNGLVTYFHNGNAIYSHEKNNLNSYRFIIANLIEHKLCKVCELSKAFGINRKNIERYVSAYREGGAAHFFEPKETRGQCHKMNEEKMTAVQADLDAGLSVYRTALNNCISEAAINYHVKNGNLKKKTVVNR